MLSLFLTASTTEHWFGLTFCNVKVNITYDLIPPDTWTQLGGKHHPSKFYAAHVQEKVKLIPTVWKTIRTKLKTTGEKRSGTSVLYGFDLASAHRCYQPRGMIIFLQMIPFTSFCIFCGNGSALWSPSPDLLARRAQFPLIPVPRCPAPVLTGTLGVL